MSFADRYVLEERLGGGGMAEVFRARSVGAEGFSRPVAIKRVVEGLAEDPKFIRLFATEAKLSSRLDHPNVVKVLDFDRDDDGVPYIVMELIDGTSLDRLLETGPVSRSVAVKIAVDVLRGLGYAHELATEDGVKGIVHRDVSPHNVLISWEGTVKVSDFGIAKAREGTLVTASEMVKGKPAYMSPEQANADALDGRSDLFAVGVILWEMLAGRQLFSGGTTQETFAKLMFAPIPPPSKLNAEVPKDLDRVTMRLLAREREDRHRDARAAIAELVACRDHPVDGIDALVSVLAERFPDAKRKPAEGGPRPPVSAVRARPPARRRNGFVLTAIVLGLGVAMVVAAVAFRGGDPSPPVKKTAVVP
ncbi:MAG TPA: serine/threonine-protein kinase, partial [Kofleriaceae bacterium]